MNNKNNKEPLLSDESASLLRMVTDLKTHYGALTQKNHSDNLQLLQMLDHTRNQWLNESAQRDLFQVQVQRLKKLHKEGLAQIQARSSKLTEFQAQITDLKTQNCRLEQEIGEYKKRMENLRQILKKEDTGTLKRLCHMQILEPNSVLKALEASYIEVCRGGDTDFEDLDGSSKESEESKIETTDGCVEVKCKSWRFVQTPQDTSKHGSKRSHLDENLPPDTDFDTPYENIIPTKKPRSTVRSVKNPAAATKLARKRSMSEPNLLEKPAAKYRPKIQPNTPSNPMASNLSPSVSMLFTPKTAPSKIWHAGIDFSDRYHNFKSSNPLDKCNLCNRIVFKTMVKCKDCSLRFHTDCSAFAPMPCLPRVDPPKITARQRPRLQDFCPSMRPYIPPILIRLVVVLEKAKLEDKGIYEKPAPEIRINNLLMELKTYKNIPNLEAQDTELLCGCVMKFLSDLRDPLIPETSYNEFVHASEDLSDNLLIMAINDLPTAHRETLAYLCIHWQKVLENPHNLMSASSLAACLGPSVVGRSRSPEISVKVMNRILSLKTDFWMSFFEFESNVRPSMTPTRAMPTPKPRQTMTPNRFGAKTKPAPYTPKYRQLDFIDA